MNQKTKPHNKHHCQNPIFHIVVVFIMVLCSLSISYGATADNNLSTYCPVWTLDSEQVVSSTHYDLSGCNIDGSIQGSPDFVELDAYNEPGREAMYVNGVDEFIEALDHGNTDILYNRDSNLSISIWFNTSTAHNGVVANVGGQSSNALIHSITVLATGEIRCSLSKNAVSNPITFEGGSYTTNVWHHLAYVYYEDNTTVECFLDNVSIGSGSAGYATLPTSSDDDLIIGHGFYNGGYAGAKFEGTLDELMLYDFPLTQNDIAVIMEDHPYDVETGGAVTYSTNYTLDITENSYTGNKVATGLLNVTCLDDTYMCNVSAYAQLNGFNASGFSDPLLLPNELAFFMNPGSVLIPFSISSNYDVVGEFSYNLSNNLSDSALYLIQQIGDLNVTINYPIPGNDTIQLALGEVCPFYESQSESQFWIYMILAGITILTIFTGFIFNSALLMLVTPFTSLYLAFASTACDMILSVTWIVIAGVACLRIFYWALDAIFLKKFRVN